MLANIVTKQRCAVSAVNMALLGVGITGRAVCVTVKAREDGHAQNRGRFAVFVASPDGSEPFYATGDTLVEAVRNTITTIKGRPNGTAADDSEGMPF